MPPVLKKIAIGFVAITIVFSGVLIWKKYSLTYANANLEKKIEKNITEINNLSQTQKVSKIKESVEILKRAQNYRTEWSQIVGEIIRQEDNTISFLNLSAGKDQKVSIKGEGFDWESIALMLERMKANPKFKNPFVHSVMEKPAKQGKSIYTFGLTFQYVPTTKNDIKLTPPKP